MATANPLVTDALTLEGPKARGTIAVWREARLWRRWGWSVCLGGATWSDPERTWWRRRVVRLAARRLWATPNREARRALAVLNRIPR